MLVTAEGEKMFAWLKRLFDRSADPVHSCDLSYVDYCKLEAELAALKAEKETAWAQAHRLALELECLLLDTKDNAIVSKWWDSGMAALDEYQQLKPGAKEDAEVWGEDEKGNTVSTPIIRLSPAPNTSMNPEQALHSAMSDDLQDVLIIGYDSAGELYIRSSKMTCAEALFMANKAMRWAECGGEL